MPLDFYIWHCCLTCKSSNRLTWTLYIKPFTWAEHRDPCLLKSKLRHNSEERKITFLKVLSFMGRENRSSSSGQTVRRQLLSALVICSQHRNKCLCQHSYSPLLKEVSFGTLSRTQDICIMSHSLVRLALGYGILPFLCLSKAQFPSPRALWKLNEYMYICVHAYHIYALIILYTMYHIMNIY